MMHTVLFEDNEACIRMSQNPVNPEAAKHIDTRRFRIRELVQDRIVWLEKTPSHLNVADALTKSLASPAFHTRLEYLKGCSIPFQPESKYARQHPDLIAIFLKEDAALRAVRHTSQMSVGG